MTEFTGYRTARRLAEKGFVEIAKIGATKSIRALSLDRIARSVGKEQRKLRRLELQLWDLVKTTDQEESRERIKTWEGKEHFLELYDSLPERCKGDLLAFGSLGGLWKVTEQDYFSRYEHDWIRRRMRRGVKAVLVEGKNMLCHQLLKRAKREMRDVRFVPIPAEADNWTALAGEEVFVFENDPYAPRVVQVQDPALVNIFRDYHRLLWK